MTYEVDEAHEADIRELIRAQLLADFGYLTPEELAEELEDERRHAMAEWWDDGEEEELPAWADQCDQDNEWDDGWEEP